MNCQEIESLTADYLGGELDEPRRERFASHLSGCAACRARIGEFEETLSELNLLMAAPPAAALECRDGDTARAHAATPTSPLRRLIFASMKAAAILVLGVLIGRASMNASRPPLAQDPPPQERVHQQHEPEPHVQVAHASFNPDVHPKWIEMGQRLGAGRSSFASQLLILARTTRP